MPLFHRQSPEPHAGQGQLLRIPWGGAKAQLSSGFFIPLVAGEHQVEFFAACAHVLETVGCRLKFVDNKGLGYIVNLFAAHIAGHVAIDPVRPVMPAVFKEHVFEKSLCRPVKSDADTSSYQLLSAYHIIFTEPKPKSNRGLSRRTVIKSKFNIKISDLHSWQYSALLFFQLHNSISFHSLKRAGQI
jgi:hypothetical protein